MFWLRKYFKHLRKRIAEEPKSFRVYTILRILVFATMIRQLYLREYENVAICILSLILFLVPSFFEERLRIKLPAFLQITIYIFIYAAEILGEVDRFYTNIPGWDTLLHTINGFICAIAGFSLIYVLNRGSKRIQLSPVYMALTAFCFSMTVGVVWEFFEYHVDRYLGQDMQKDMMVTTIRSTYLDETKSQRVVTISGIEYTTLTLSDGSEYVIENGYLDIGINDTMKDLLVNFLGATVACAIGGIYMAKNKDNEEEEAIKNIERYIIKPVDE